MPPSCLTKPPRPGCRPSSGAGGLNNGKSLRGATTFVAILLLVMAPTFIVSARTPTAYSSTPYYLLFGGVLVLTLFIMQSWLRTNSGAIRISAAPNISRSHPEQFKALFWVILLLTAAHYVLLKQIPLFSPKIDVIRFQAASSGYFGIPSRAATVGPILLAAALPVVWNQLSVRSRATYCAALIALFAFRGHKSALIELLVACLLILPWRLTLRSFVCVSLAGLGAAAFTYLSALRYATVDLQAGFGAYVYERAAIYQHKLVSFLAYKEVRYDIGSILTEMAYPILKLMDPSTLTMNQRLSALYYGRSFNDFTVPVTPGPVGWGLMLGGATGVFFVAVCVPFMALALAKARDSTRAPTRLLGNYFTCVAFVGITSGNFFYWLSNTALSAALLLGLSYGLYVGLAEMRAALIRT